MQTLKARAGSGSRKYIASGQMLSTKEKAYAVLAVLGAFLAGFGAFKVISHFVGHSYRAGEFSTAVAATVFVGTLALMLKGVEAMRSERVRQDMKKIEEIVEQRKNNAE
jgi:hypothetical protein